MLKKRVKQIVSLFTALSLGSTLLMSSSLTATAIENIQLGQNGYASLHSYINAVPGYDDVFQVDMTIDLNTRIDPLDVVFVIDNSGSMGYPEDDLSVLGPLADEYELLGKIPSQFAAAVAATIGTGGPSSLNWANPDPYDPAGYPATTGMAPLPQGAWRYGAEYNEFVTDGYFGPAAALRMFDSSDSQYYRDNNGYRFEWMQDGLEEAVRILLDPTTNGTAKQNRVAVVAFGDGSTNTGDDSGNINMLPGANPDEWDREADYDFTTIGGVWKNAGFRAASAATPAELYLDGMVGHTLGYADEITFVSGNVPMPITFGTKINEDAWVDSNGLQDLLDRISRNPVNPPSGPKLVRRAEGTSTASGLAAAYDILTAKPNTNPDTKKYVFLLTDGAEMTTRKGNIDPATDSPEFSFTESLAISVNLQKEGVNMAGLGILEDDESLFDGSKFEPSQFANARETFNNAPSSTYPAPTTIEDFLEYEANVNGKYDGLAGEAHLLRTLLPLRENSSLLTGPGYSSTSLSGKTGSTKYMMGFGSGDYSADSSNNGYDLLAKDMINDADLSRLNYARANNSKEVIDVFRDFAKSLTTLADAKSDVMLGEYFTIYQMPGKDLFTATNGSSASGGGRSFAWNMPDVGAAGGSYKLTFYVKLNAPADQANVWQSLFSSWMLKFKDFNGNLVKKGFPQVYAQSTSTGEAEVEVDHRLRDVVPVAKKAQAAFTLAFSDVPQNVRVTNLSAKLNASKKGATLQIEAKGDEDLYYQWFYRKSGDTEWTKIPGAISSVYNYSNMKAGEYFFRCGYRYASTGFSYSNEVSVTIGK